MEVRGQHEASFAIALHLTFFETGCLTKPWMHWLGKTGHPVSSRGSRFSASPVLSLQSNIPQCMDCMWALGAPNSGPHYCMVVTLQMVPSSHPQYYSYTSFDLVFSFVCFFYPSSLTSHYFRKSDPNSHVGTLYQHVAHLISISPFPSDHGPCDIVTCNSPQPQPFNFISVCLDVHSICLHFLNKSSLSESLCL